MIKKTKKIAKTYLPSIVLIGKNTNFVYQLLNTKPMTKKKVELLDADIQKQIQNGELKFSLAYKVV